MYTSVLNQPDELITSRTKFCLIIIILKIMLLGTNITSFVKMVVCLQCAKSGLFI